MSDLLHLMPGCRPPVADIGQSGGLRPIGAPGYSANSLKIKGLALWPGDCTSEGRGIENEKRIADSGRFTDDAGAGRRAGRRPRVRGGGPSVLWRFLPALLGPSLLRRLLRESQRGRS